MSEVLLLLLLLLLFMRVVLCCVVTFLHPSAPPNKLTIKMLEATLVMEVACLCWHR